VTRSRPFLICLFLLASVSGFAAGIQLGIPVPGFADINSLALAKDGLNPDFALSYFDDEGNTPDSGQQRSFMTLVTEPDGNGAAVSSMRFTIDISSGEDHYIGWYISAEKGIVDITNKSVARFELKGSPNIPTSEFQIGLRSRNVNPGNNRAKVFLSELGFKKMPDKFTTVEVPFSFLRDREPHFDLTQANDLLIFSVISPDKSIHQGRVWIRNARLSWDVQKTAGGIVANLPDVLFDFDKTNLKSRFYAYLDRIIQVINSQPGCHVTVEGHTDIIGTDKYNMVLSRRRAQNVANYLIQKGYVSSAQIATVGFGFHRPIALNDTPVGRARNRRVEIVISGRTSDNTISR